MNWSFIRLLRPWQWYKNVALLLAILFSGQLFDSSLYIKLLFGFVILCLASSGNYAVNILEIVKRIRKILKNVIDLLLQVLFQCLKRGVLQYYCGL